VYILCGRKYHVTETNQHAYCVFIALSVNTRVPTPPGKSWIFFLENSRTWKVLEKHFGPGKSWKNILENTHFLVVMENKQK